MANKGTMIKGDDLPDFDFLSRPGLKILRAKIDELELRAKAQGSLKRVASQQLAKAEAAALAAEVSLALGQGTSHALAGARAAREASKVVHPSAALDQDQDLLWHAIVDLRAPYEADRESAAAAEVATLRAAAQAAADRVIAAIQFLAEEKTARLAVQQ